MPKDYYPIIVEEVEDRIYLEIASRLPPYQAGEPDNLLDQLRDYVKGWVAKWSQPEVLSAYEDRRRLCDSATALRIGFLNKVF